MTPQQVAADVRAAAERVREDLRGARRRAASLSPREEDVAALLAEHDRLAAADPVAVVARVDLEGVLAGHRWGPNLGCLNWDCDYDGTEADHPAHQAERVRAALTEALGGGGA